MPVQDHIHIGTTLEGAENAPSNKYRARARTPFWRIETQIDRGLTGKLFFDGIRDGNGDIIRFDEYDYNLLVSLDEIEVLKSMLGREVYLVDHVHPDDGEDHSAYVRSVVFAAMKYVSNIGPKLRLNIVAISFIDNDTVT